MPWKNGGGETLEIAVSPDCATLDDFDWRVSMAKVERGGPFSAFPGVDRTLAVLEGDGIVLTIGTHPPVTQTMSHPPLPFDAGAVVHSQLCGGPVTDLNLMTRRGGRSHRMTVLDPDQPQVVELHCQEAFLLAWNCSVCIESDNAPVILSAGDVLFIRRPDRSFKIGPAMLGRVYLLEIFGAEQT